MATNNFATLNRFATSNAWRDAKAWQRDARGFASRTAPRLFEACATFEFEAATEAACGLDLQARFGVGERAPEMLQMIEQITF
jgi:hypothetical protein